MIEQAGGRNSVVLNGVLWVLALVSFFAGGLYVGERHAVQKPEPAPCLRCLTLGERAWFMGEIDPLRPHDGVLVTLTGRQKDGTVQSTTRRFAAVDFKNEAAPQQAVKQGPAPVKQPPIAPISPAAAQAIEQGKRDLAGAQKMVRP
jgi:hypothetical protein